MTFTVYKPPPREANSTRSMSEPALYLSRTKNGGAFYANASLMVQLRADANRVNVRATGEAIPDTEPLHVVMLADKAAGLFGLAATIEGDPNATLMRLNASRKAVIPSGLRIAADLNIPAGRYPTREATIEGATVRVLTFRPLEGTITA